MPILSSLFSLLLSASLVVHFYFEVAPGSSATTEDSNPTKKAQEMYGSNQICGSVGRQHEATQQRYWDVIETLWCACEL